MSETVKAVEDRGEDPRKGKPRPTSDSKFPYYDLADSIRVASVLHEQAGGSCQPDQLAALMNHRGVKSGAFTSRVGAARQFGLVERTSTGTLRLSSRGRAIVAPGHGESDSEAKVEACLDVDLFAKVFDHYQGSTLPEPIGLENAIQAAFGVVPGRAKTAVRVLLNSAREAGLLTGDIKGMRMVKPIALPTSESVRDSLPKSVEEPERTGGGGGGGGGDGGIDPAIQGLLEKLPPSGTPLARTRRDALINAFTACIDFIYPTEAENERPQTSIVD